MVPRDMNRLEPYRLSPSFQRAVPFETRGRCRRACPLCGQGGNTYCTKTPRKLSGFRGVFAFVKNDPAKLGHFCRAGGAPFYALRGVMGFLGAEIPAGFLGLAGMWAPAEDSPPSGGCPVGAIMQANRVFYAANSVRGCGTRRRGRLSLAAWLDIG